MRFVLGFILASLFLMPAPVEAAGVPVFIESHVGSQDANLRRGAGWVDKYTGTRFVFGKCREKYRCIRVTFDRSNLKPGTAWSAWKRADSRRMLVRITVNPGRGSGYMSRLFAHEVGHAMRLGHSRYATNLMWPDLFKANGNMVPIRFTAPQIRTLREN